MLTKIRLFLNSYHFNVETHRSEAVVATDHGAQGILHPSVIEVSLATGQRLDEFLHGAPGRRTHPFRTLTVHRNPFLSLQHIASVFDRVLIFRHQIRIRSLPDGCDSDFHLNKKFCVFNDTECSEQTYEFHGILSNQATHCEFKES